LFLAEAEGQSNKYKNSTNPKGYGRNKLPPSPTHGQGGGNRGKTPGLKPAPSAQALKTTAKCTRNSQPKENIYQKPKEKPNSEKNQKNPKP